MFACSVFYHIKYYYLVYLVLFNYMQYISIYVKLVRYIKIIYRTGISNITYPNVLKAENQQ